MTTQPTTIKTTRHGRLSRQWFRTVLRDYRHSRLWTLCENSKTFRLAWNDATSHDYLRKLAIRFCASHKTNFSVGDVILFKTHGFTPVDERFAVRTTFLRWCIASTANRTA